MQACRRLAVSLVFTALAGLAAGGCGRTTSQAAPGATATPSDLDFFTNEYDVIHFDQAICQQAQQRSSDPKIKAMANDILQSTNNFDKQVQPLAAAKGVQPPQTLRSDLRTRLVFAENSVGVPFDRQFVAAEIATHQEALARAGLLMRDPATDPDLRKFLVEARRLLLASLRQLAAEQARVGQPTYDTLESGGGGGR